MKIIDANIILRYLLSDHKTQSKTASTIIEDDQIFIPFEVIAEVVYVLEKVYKVKRFEITSIMISLINYENIETFDQKVIGKAFQIYNDENMDFVDSILCSYNVSRNYEVLSFDKAILKYLSKSK